MKNFILIIFIISIFFSCSKESNNPPVGYSKAKVIFPDSTKCKYYLEISGIDYFPASFPKSYIVQNKEFYLTFNKLNYTIKFDSRKRFDFRPLELEYIDIRNIYVEN